MSKTKYPLPPDIRRMAIEMVRGHERRVKAYREARYCILQGSPCNYVTYTWTHKRKDGVTRTEERRQYFPHGSAISDPTADKQLRLDALEEHVETKRMRAVEQALHNVGADMVNDGEIVKLRAAIWDSCIDGRNFVFAYRNLCVSKGNFYERRSQFLSEIAQKTNFL